MNIAYSCNDNYIEQTGVSIISVCENNKSVYEITFYLISMGISQNNIQLLEGVCSKYDRKLIVIDFEDIAYDLDISAIGRHVVTIYAKVFFSRIPNLDKVIYLDSDTIIIESLDSLWETDLTDCYLGAVETFAKKSIRQQLGIPLDAPFFNDGVVLENVKYCREHDLIGKVKEVISSFNGAPPTLSEGALNKVCFERIKYISPKWNMMAGLLFFGLKDINYLTGRLHYKLEAIEDSLNHPVVIHYLTAFYNRPWFIKCSHPLKHHYLKYKEISPWKDNPLKDGDLPLKIKVIRLVINIIGPTYFDYLRKISNMISRFK